MIRARSGHDLSSPGQCSKGFVRPRIRGECGAWWFYASYVVDRAIHRCGVVRIAVQRIWKCFA